MYSDSTLFSLHFAHLQVNCTFSVLKPTDFFPSQPTITKRMPIYGKLVQFMGNEKPLKALPNNLLLPSTYTGGVLGGLMGNGVAEGPTGETGPYNEVNLESGL